MVRKFTKKLDELFVKQNIGLLEALNIISHGPSKSGDKKYEKKWGCGGRAREKIARTAEYLYQQMETGNLISNAFRSCPYISFDEKYVSFVALAEGSGDLKNAVIYLNDKYERSYQNKLKVMEASFYPLFVIILSIIAGLFLVKFTDGENYLSLIEMTIILTCVCVGLLYFIIKVMAENPLYEAFLTIDFLLKSGVCMSEAIGCAIQIVGIKSKTGRAFEDAREKLEFGMSLQNALQLGERYEEGFYFAEKAGGKTEVFGKMALWLNVEWERRRKFCLSIMEPLFILLAGIFLLALILKYFLPYITDLNWI